MSKTYKAGKFIESQDSVSSEEKLSSTVETPFDAAIFPNNDEDNTSELMTFHDAKPSVMVVVLTFVASISGFMFGYDTGYISSALVSVGTDFGKVLTSGEKEFITSATSLGALIAAIGAGILADVVGRKPVLLFSNVLFIIGSAIQCGSHTVWTMILGRFVMGFGVGVGSLIAPLYISECAPSKYRGRLVVINVLLITGGQLIAYGLGAAFNHVNNGWRILVGLSIVPPFIQLVTFFFLPDTPRYLILKGRLDEAALVLKRTYKSADDDLIEQKILELLSWNQDVDGSNAWTRTWNAVKDMHRIPSNFRALIIACGLQGIQQFTGWNSLMYFSATIFETIGFNDSTAVSVIIAATNFIFTCVAFFVIDRVGRRRILLIGIPGMCAALVLCAILFHFLGINFNNSGDAVVKTTGITGWGVVVIIAMILFAACYAVGIGNVPWQQSELFPQSVRGVGAAYLTLTNWAGSLVIASTFLTMLENITPTGTFAFFAALAFISFIFVFFCYPELSNLELEEVQQVLTGGFNIVASKKLAKKRRADTARRLKDAAKPEDQVLKV